MKAPFSIPSSLRVPALLGALLTVCASAAPAQAQDLNIGSPAPQLSVEEWLKGSEVKAFASGQIYVVEFWATWCPPCLKSIPHLTELQHKYKDQKVSILGIASSERSRQKDADLRTPLVKFVEGQGDKMDYAVAYDSDRSMATSWMQAANQGGIPTAFVVDGTGTIAWIGHPMEMDEPLAAIVAGKWDLKAEAAKAKAAAEFEAKLEPIMNRLGSAYQGKKWDEALKAVDEAIALGEKAEQRLAGAKVDVMFKLGQFDGAYAYAEKAAAGALKNDAQALNMLAWMMVDPDNAETVTVKNYPVAKKLATRAVELSKGKPEEPMFLDTLAAVYAAMGDFAKAVELQTKAVELMAGKEGVEEYESKLESYKKSSGKA